MSEELLSAIRKVLIDNDVVDVDQDKLDHKIYQAVADSLGATQEKLLDSLQMERDRSRALERRVAALEEIVQQAAQDERKKAEYTL